jgi:ribosomal protein S1
LATKKTNTKKETSGALTMEQLLNRTGYKLKSFTRGEKVKAKLLRINERSAAFDIGGKSEGLITELNFVEARNLIERLKVGDEVTAVVVEPENSEGATLLSLRGAAHDDFWKKIERIYKNGETLEVVVKSLNPHGLVVGLEAETAFIPNSQLGTLAAEKGEEIIGARIKTKIIDIDQNDSKIVLSEKAVSEAHELAQFTEALATVKPGEQYEGVVTTVTYFGAFVQINVPSAKGNTKVEGLVHVSELSWAKVERPEDVIAVGDKVKVKVLGIDKGKLSFSIKQAGEDPWHNAEKKYKPDDKVSGKVLRVSDFGVFVELAPGIEGLVHMTKIPPATPIKVGQKVDCYIEEVDTRDKKIALGLVITTAKPIGYK